MHQTNENSVSQSTRFYGLFLILYFVFSCDTFREDSIQPENQVTFNQSEFYTLPGSSILIDLNAIVKKSFARVTISISGMPARGTLSEVDTRLLVYRPDRDFQGGVDYFDLSVVSEGKTLATKTLTVSMKSSKEEFPCAPIAVEDKIKVKSGSSASVSILDNDWLCDMDESGVHVLIYSQPVFGQAAVDGESINYIPGPDYKGHDELIYKMTQTESGNAIYGLLSVTGATVQSMNTPGNSITKMVFVDEITGYLAGDGIYKTIDGGEHWNQILNPTNIDGGLIKEIQFLDATNGFALYSSCEVSSLNCINGLATTKDGGASWTLTPIDYSLDMSSVFFTTATTGFISGLDWSDSKSVVLKTTDGGESWEQLPVSNFDALVYRYLILKYADSHNGYAYQYANIFITQDAGESWEPYTFYEDLPTVFYEDILCMDVVDENTIFAGLSLIGSFTHPTSIVKFDSRSTPKEVAVIPYKIWQIDFSPSGNVGIAVGIKETDPPLDLHPVSLVIHKSMDKGETWNEESFEEYIYDPPYIDIPTALSVPSENVVYILYAGKLIRYCH